MASLDQLHVEILDQIVDLLDARDAAAVRLASRALARSVAFNHRHQQRYRHITLELGTRSLAAFAAATAAVTAAGAPLPSLVTAHLASLTLRGVARNKRAVDWAEIDMLRARRVPAADIPVHVDPEIDRDAALPEHGTAEYDSDSDSPADHARLLGAAFAHLRQRAPRAALDTLTLVVGQSTAAAAASGSGSIYKPSWRAVWAAAEHAFVTAAAALRMSRLPVDHLDVFRSLQRCAIPHSVFLDAFGRPPPASSPAPMATPMAMPRKVSVCLSLRPLSAGVDMRDRLLEKQRADQDSIAAGLDPDAPFEPGLPLPPTPERTRVRWAARDGRRHAAARAAASRLLRAVARRDTPLAAVEDLDIAWLSLAQSLDPGGADPDPADPAGDAPDAQDTAAVTINRRVALRGFRFGSGEVETTLAAARLAHLTLESVRLPSVPDAASLLAWLWGSDLPSFYLEDLFVGVKLVHYGVPGAPKFPYVGYPDIGPSVLERGPDDGRQARRGPPPSTAIATVRPMASSERNRWDRARLAKSAPPNAQYDLVHLNPHMRVRPSQ